MDILLNKIYQHSNKILAGFGLLTLMICFMPLIFKDPGDASLDPKKEAYEVQQRINEKFVESVHFVSIVMEADDGDMIDKQSLNELLNNQERLIELDSNQSLSAGSLKPNSYLWNGYDESTSTTFTGVYTIANIVDSALKMSPDFPNGLNDASEDDVKIALHQIFESGVVGDPKFLLAKGAKSEIRTIKSQEINYWTSPALFIDILSEND